MPVRSFTASVFRHPTATPNRKPLLKLLHMGNLGQHQPRRRKIVKAVLKQKRYPTQNGEEAARLYAKHALDLNVPLN